MYMTFGEAFAAILRKKKLSISSAAEELGFSSKTALFRIIRGESKPSSNQRCLELAMQSQKIALTDEEIRELRSALKVSRIGSESYAMSLIFEEILHPKAVSEEPLLTRLEGCKEGKTFEELLSFYKPLENIQITIYGKCSKQTLARLHRFTLEADVSRILHVFNIDARRPEDISMLGTASNILFSPIYKLCTVKTTQDLDQNWFFRSGLILISAQISEKKRCAHQLSALKDGSLFVVRNDAGVLQTFWRRMFEDAEDRLVCVKRDQSHISQSPFPYNYVDFIEEYEKIERNRAIYMIKPDLPICCIPSEVLCGPVGEGLEDIGFSTQESDVYERMYAIHSKRCANLFEKRKDTHIILNREAMRLFAITGRREDHLFFPRPYTSQERVAILQNLLAQMKHSRYFHIWFSKDSSFVRDKEVTAYEGLGVAVIRSDTSWHLEHDHQEIFIENKEMAHYFKEYILSEVLEDGVLTREQSIAEIEELIELARKSEE